jgi:hypothetical protein
VKRILDHVDLRVAHRDRAHGSVSLPTWNDLDEALDHVVSVFKKYFLLLTGGQYLVEDTIMPLGWEKIFRQLEPQPRVVGAQPGQSPSRSSPSG